MEKKSSRPEETDITFLSRLILATILFQNDTLFAPTSLTNERIYYLPELVCVVTKCTDV